MRSAICQDELLQAVGRARGVNRTAANPVEVILVGNVPVPGLVAEREAKLAEARAELTGDTHMEVRVDGHLVRLDQFEG